MERPPWLDDERELLNLLGRLLDKLDRRPAEDRMRPPAETIKAGRFRKLFRNNEASDQSWLLLEQLEARGLILIQPTRQRSEYDPLYQGARVQLLPAAEGVLRQWLGRPQITPYRIAWQQAVRQMADRFPGRVNALVEWPIEIRGRDAAELVERLTMIGPLSAHSHTLRQLSAHCFWGLSKLLDNREEQLKQLYPRLNVLPRRILVNATLPSNVDGILMIENLDNYLSLLDQKIPQADGLALIYCAGFRGSAQRIRQPESVSFHYHGEYTEEQEALFRSWWFEQGEVGYPAYFWGDLDYAGMTILKALRQRFPGLEAWQPGYRPMLDQLASGHSAESAGKQLQIDPGETGCAFADRLLLPAIRGSGRFVDQEAIFL